MNKDRRKRDFLEARHLRYFLAVAEELHFGRAAERLRIEQSPLSRAIRDLERNLAVRLFERTTRSTRLTWAGELFAEHARRILGFMHQATDDVRSAALGHSWQLRLGVCECIAHPLLPELLARHEAEEPSVDVVLLEMCSLQQVWALRDERLDVSISFNGEVRDGVLVEGIWRDPIAAVLPVSHPLAQLKSITLGDLKDQPFVVVESDSTGVCSQTDAIIHRLAERPRIAKRTGSFGAALTWIAAGNGVGIAGKSQITAIQPRGIVFRPIKGHVPMLTTYMRRADGDIAQPVMRFLDRARTIAANAVRAVSTSGTLGHQ